MAPLLDVRSVPQVWQIAIFGTVASVPATVVLNWLPDSEATIGGGVMIIGAMIAGALAVSRWDRLNFHVRRHGGSDSGVVSVQAGVLRYRRRRDTVRIAGIRLSLRVGRRPGGEYLAAVAKNAGVCRLYCDRA